MQIRLGPCLNMLEHGRGTHEKKNRLQTSSRIFEDIHTCQNNLSNQLKSIWLWEYHEPLLKTLALCLRNTKCFYRANFPSRAYEACFVVEPNTRRAPGIAVDFVSDHLKDKKVTEYQHIGQTFIWRSGTSDPVSNNPSYSSSAKCALKDWNALELTRFLKPNLNPVVADLKQLPMTFAFAMTKHPSKRGRL